MKTTNSADGVNGTAGSATKAKAKEEEKEKPRRRTALVARRKAVGWTQQNLAASLGVHTNTVSRWERGLSMPLAWVRDAIAEALKLTVFQLDALLEYRPLPEPQISVSAPILLHRSRGRLTTARGQRFQVRGA